MNLKQIIIYLFVFFIIYYLLDYFRCIEGFNNLEYNDDFIDYLNKKGNQYKEDMVDCNQCIAPWGECMDYDNNVCDLLQPIGFRNKNNNLTKCCIGAYEIYPNENENLGPEFVKDICLSDDINGVVRNINEPCEEDNIPSQTSKPSPTQSPSPAQKPVPPAGPAPFPSPSPPPSTEQESTSDSSQSELTSNNEKFVYKKFVKENEQLTNTEKTLFFGRDDTNMEFINNTLTTDKWIECLPWIKKLVPKCTDEIMEKKLVNNDGSPNGFCFILKDNREGETHDKQGFGLNIFKNIINDKFYGFCSTSNQIRNQIEFIIWMGNSLQETLGYPSSWEKGFPFESLYGKGAHQTTYATNYIMASYSPESPTDLSIFNQSLVGTYPTVDINEIQKNEFWIKCKNNQPIKYIDKWWDPEIQSATYKESLPKGPPYTVSENLCQGENYKLLSNTAELFWESSIVYWMNSIYKQGADVLKNKNEFKAIYDKITNSNNWHATCHNIIQDPKFFKDITEKNVWKMAIITIIIINGTIECSGAKKQETTNRIKRMARIGSIFGNEYINETNGFISYANGICTGNTDDLSEPYLNKDCSGSCEPSDNIAENTEGVMVTRNEGVLDSVGINNKINIDEDIQEDVELKDTITPWKYGSMGYLENWNPMTHEYMKSYDIVLYSFLTLVKEPNWRDPPKNEVGKKYKWAPIYESASREDLLDVFNNNDLRWARTKIINTMKYCCDNN